MAILQVNENKITKDGRKWVFTTYYNDLNGNKKKYFSKRYKTKKEAQEAEIQFKLSLNQDYNYKDMTFKDLYNAFYEYQEDKVKITTLRTYIDRKKFLEILNNVKLKDFSISHYEFWKKEINKNNFSTRYKNDIYKFLKATLNFATKRYDFNFTNVYSKMVNFTDPNERKKEMLFFTFEEFQKFLSVEDDLKYRCLYEMLYYCGLRKGEARGITWKDLDFTHNTVDINKNIVPNLNKKKFVITSPKTKSSIRNLPMPDILVEDLKTLYKESKNIYNFNNNWYVFGDHEPIGPSPIMNRKNRNCKLANVKQIRIHDFRHSCASLLINNGANITLVAKYLGHTKIEETLNTYSHMFKNKLEDIITIINELNQDYKNKLPIKKTDNNSIEKKNHLYYDYDEDYKKSI